DGQHLFGKIDARDFRARQFFRNGEREISRAGSKIDNFIRAPAGHDFRGAVSPIKISAATEQMVGEIVAAGNWSKNPLDPLRLRFDSWLVQALKVQHPTSDILLQIKLKGAMSLARQKMFAILSTSGYVQAHGLIS